MTARSNIKKPVPAVVTSEIQFDIAHRLSLAVWVFDIDQSRILQANPGACKLWGAESEAELCSRNLGRDMSVTVEKRLKQYQSDFSNSDAIFKELWTLYPNGMPESVMVTYRGFTLADGRMAMLCEAASSADDTPENLRSAEALLHTDVLIMLFSKDGPPLYLNPAARNAFVGPISSYCNLFLDHDECRKMSTQVEIVGEFRVVVKLKTGGGARWFDITTKDCSDAATGRPAILMTAIDVTQLKEARDTARFLADRDQLTNVYNRTYLQTQLSNYNGSDDRENAIIFFDVDRFKLINDRHGHQTGDTVLKEIAKRVGNCFPEGDLVARLGGDEFVVLVQNYAGVRDLKVKIEKLRQAIAEPIEHETTRIDVTISVGVSIFSPASSEFGDVLGDADIALYASKQQGRDRVTFFSHAMGVAAKARDRLEFELKRGIERDEFELYYQPRLDFSSGHIVGAEGLVRWNHPDRGLVYPGEFVSVCEETGLIEELGRKVLFAGCQQAIEWKKAGLDLAVSLNVSPRQFSDPGLLQTLSDIAAQPDFPHGQIELEVTENVLIGDPASITAKLKTITSMGYRLAIDDFGTGYSNLAYILQFPLSCLKIDQSFIDNLPESGPIVQLILTLGQQIGATVVSEGVETNAQFDWLAARNCTQAQGFLISRALSVADFEAFCAPH